MIEHLESLASQRQRACQERKRDAGARTHAARQLPSPDVDGVAPPHDKAGAILRLVRFFVCSTFLRLCSTAELCTRMSQPQTIRMNHPL